MAELLLEIFCEEIPARMQSKASSDLKALIEKGLKASNLSFDSIENHVTPRRLVVVVDGLPDKQPDLKEERKGPKVGAPDKAIEGFLKSAGLDSLDDCEARDTPKGAIWFAVSEKKGQSTRLVLPSIILDAIKALPWPNSMRFADQSFRWVRPLRSIIAVFDGVVLDGTLDMGGKTLSFGCETKGHRFLSSGTFSVENFQDYKDKLEAASVILDASKRKSMIESQLLDRASEQELTLVPDAGLLEEVTGLVEWPEVVIGRIDDVFMDVPRECLTSSMRTHQKYFTLNNANGDMAPYFALVANITADDGGARIQEGNERVLRARLADAKFFWDQDLAKKLDDNLPKLEKVIFHAKLGSVSERIERMTAMAGMIAERCGSGLQTDAMRAATLAKADLVSEMVFEFPELQGIMGRYYAKAQGENDAVAEAIAEHYSPAGPSDACPSSPVSVAVAIAEKLDTLCGFWLIDEKPTGSKDPFALRRAALGIIRLILENNVRFSLKALLLDGLKLYKLDNMPGDLDAIAQSLLEFFADRMKVHLKGEGVRHDLIQAVFALGTEDDFVRLIARVRAIEAFLSEEDGANLLIAYRRGANILKAEEKKDGTQYLGQSKADGFHQDEERKLAYALAKTGDLVADQMGAEDFDAAMTSLSGLRSSVDAFFDQVTVNAEDADLRVNRLELLAEIRAVMGTVADFSQVEG